MGEGALGDSHIRSCAGLFTSSLLACKLAEVRTLADILLAQYQAGCFAQSRHSSKKMVRAC